MRTSDKIEYSTWDNVKLGVHVDGKRLPIQLNTGMCEPVVAIMEDGTILISKVSANPEYDCDWLLMQDGEYYLSTCDSYRSIPRCAPRCCCWTVSDFEDDEDVDEDGVPLYKIVVTDIEWDADEDDGEPPKETTWVLEDYPLDDEHPDDMTDRNKELILDEVSNQAWFCIKSATISEVVKNPPVTFRGAAVRELPDWAYRFLYYSDDYGLCRLRDVGSFDSANYVWCLDRNFVEDIKTASAKFAETSGKSFEEECEDYADRVFERSRTIIQGTSELIVDVIVVTPDGEISNESCGGYIAEDAEKDETAFLINAAYDFSKYSKEEIKAGIARAKGRYVIARYTTTDEVF